MPFIIRLALLVICLPAIVSAQVGIGTNSPATSAQLDVSSTAKGFLPPRMTSAQRLAIVSPTAGLVVYQTDGTSGLYYFNGGSWVAVSASSAPFTCGTSTVTFIYRGSSVTYGTVVGANGRCWLDRNLGATQVATAYNDANAYGDLFQWGRGDDGHQLRNSSTSATQISDPSPTSPNTSFIYNADSWLNERMDYLWQGSYGFNNVCPAGWHIPTESEWFTQLYSTSPTFISSELFNSSLKLTTAGIRDGTNGNIANPGVWGHYWTSSLSSRNAGSSYGNKAYAISFRDTPQYKNDDRVRSFGLSVRCIKD